MARREKLIRSARKIRADMMKVIPRLNEGQVWIIVRIAITVYRNCKTFTDVRVFLRYLFLEYGLVIIKEQLGVDPVDVTKKVEYQACDMHLYGSDRVECSEMIKDMEEI